MPDASPAKNTESIIAVVGNPNTGKSALFNNLTGLRQKTANYPGVTVERHTGTLKLAAGDVTLVDLPGAYSLAPYSPDEMVSADVLLGHIDDMPLPSAVLIVVDAANLRRNLFMATQVLELGPANATIHQLNEQVRVADLPKLATIYRGILETLLT